MGDHYFPPSFNKRGEESVLKTISLRTKIPLTPIEHIKNPNIKIA
ncbi:hypothetical protein [Leptospira sanjuanensis]|nr:hypothetical protein [Leptospira sanjuanensis]